MKHTQKWTALLLCAAVLLGTLSACGSGSAEESDDVQIQPSASSGPVESPAADQPESQLAKVDMTQWQYQAENDVYWQTGILYCENPADESYETLGIYVPGAYLDGTENGDGTYTCTVNGSAAINGFTAQTAPIVIPVETPGYSAMAAPTGYASSTAPYTAAGFVYVYAGCRGRDAGAPAGVTDLKAAIRYIRCNGDELPGSTERIFSFGMSGGGAQSALLGATGDSALYTPYLDAIGAVAGVSDAVAGSMCWCPITGLDYANEAYEWNLGVTRTGLDAGMQALSDALAEQFALYINDLGLTDGEGNVLILTASEEGIYQAGSYYDYLKDVVETSLNHFLEDTSFPYTASSGGRGGFGGGMMDLPEGEAPDFGRDGGKDGGGRGGMMDGGGLPDGIMDGGELPDGIMDGGGRGGMMGGGIEDIDGIDRIDTSSGVTLSGTYDTAQDYIDALNAETQWVSYDSETNTASITSIADFVRALKPASKSLGAFDDLDETQGENILFGDGDGAGDHFDPVMAELLAGTGYEDAFTEDLARTDALGNSVAYRVNMYTPLYYLSRYYEGYGAANVAQYWRIRSGINQSDTALSTEVNLALALENYGADVDFETVWGQGHVEAERTGSSTDNFIAWVIECC